jgi:hypothetical protein
VSGVAIISSSVPQAIKAVSKESVPPSGGSAIAITIKAFCSK